MRVRIKIPVNEKDTWTARKLKQRYDNRREHGWRGVIGTEHVMKEATRPTGVINIIF